MPEANDEDACPWCDSYISDLWQYFHNGATEAVFECPTCDREICAQVETSFWVSRMEKGEPNGED
jgi:hypothetical protein